MASSSRDDDETSGRHRFGCLHVELVAPTDVKRAGDDGEVPVGWVDVWRNAVAVGQLQPVGERKVGHRAIALEGGALGSARNRSGAVLPPHLVLPHHDGRLCYGGRRIRRLLARRPRKRERYGPGCHGPVVESVHGDGTSRIRVRPNGWRLSCGALTRNVSCNILRVASFKRLCGSTQRSKDYGRNPTASLSLDEAARRKD